MTNTEDVRKITSDMSLQEIQQVSLEILKEVHKFCVGNGIRYSLAYGTLIGAIRHKGFIPWDDDIDIFMPRQDYDRFCRTFRHDDLQVVSRTTHKDCLIAFARVCDIRRTSVFSYCPWIRNQGNLGIWIDIFPLDATPQNTGQLISNVRHIQNRLEKTRKALRPLFIRQESFGFNFNTIKKRLFCMFLSKPEKYADRLIGCISNEPSCDTETLIQFTYTQTYSIFRSDDFKSYHEVPFEDCSFLVAEGYDNILRTTYGDYMQLPPPEKRVPQQSYIHFRWRN